MKKIISSLFSFRKPQFKRFQFSELIIDNRPLFLFEGEISHAYKISIRPGGGSYRTNKISVLIPVSPLTNELTIKCSNFWRSATRVVYITHTEFDKSTEKVRKAKIISRFPNVALQHPRIEIKSQIVARYIEMHVNTPAITVRNKEFVPDPFIYQNNNYE